MCHRCPQQGRQSIFTRLVVSMHTRINSKGAMARFSSEANK